MVISKKRVLIGLKTWLGLVLMTLTGLKTWLGPVLVSLYHRAALSYSGGAGEHLP